MGTWGLVVIKSDLNFQPVRETFCAAGITKSDQRNKAQNCFKNHIVTNYETYHGFSAGILRRAFHSFLVATFVRIRLRMLAINYKKWSFIALIYCPFTSVNFHRRNLPLLCRSCVSLRRFNTAGSFLGSSVQFML